MKQHLLRTGVIWALLLLFMTLFQPKSLPAIMLIVPFLLLFGAFYSLWSLAAHLRLRFGGKPTTRLSRRLGLTVCGSVVLLLILQSLGQLTLRDIVTVVAIVWLGYLYVARSRFSQSK